MGVTITKDNSLKAKAAARGVAKDAVEAAANAGVLMAVSLCPIGPGKNGTHLFQTIRKEGQGLKMYVIVGDSSKGIDYARFVEFGTEHMSGQPFMGPAIPEMKAVLAAAARTSAAKRFR